VVREQVFCRKVSAGASVDKHLFDFGLDVERVFWSSGEHAFREQMFCDLGHRARWVSHPTRTLSIEPRTSPDTEPREIESPRRGRVTMVAVLLPHRDAPGRDEHTHRPHLRIVESPSATAATYLRRRIVAGVVVLALLLGSVLAARAIVAAVVPEVPTTSPTVVESAAGVQIAAPVGVVIVQPGDTLWSIARALQPTGDVRPLVQRLAELNGGAALTVGQAIRLP